MNRDEDVAKRHYYAEKEGFMGPEVVAISSAMREDGATLAQVAKALNILGLKSPQGKEFYPNTVKRILDDPEGWT